MNKFKLMMGVILLIGVSSLYFSFKFFMEGKYYKDNAASTYGEVVSFEERKGNDSTTYAPVVEFITHDGQTITHPSTSSSSSPDYAIGELVEILYNPQKPSHARINDFSTLWGASLISGLFGFVFTGFGMAGIKFDMSFDDDEEDDDDE